MWLPIVFGDRGELGDVIEQMGSVERPYEELLKKGTELDVHAWMRQRVEEDPDYYQADGEGAEDEPAGGALDGTSMVALDLVKGTPKPEVFIGLIPVSQPWQVPAYLRTGGWNECPPPEVHVAFFKRWFEQYGAVVTGISRDIIEFSVSRPPSTEEQARELAHEHFVYCADIVLQESRSEKSLAKELPGSRNWYFWWD